MADKSDTVEVVVCLGSSCFARGNAQNLSAIESHLAHHGLQSLIHLKGCLCQDECKHGPNLVVNGEHEHGVDPVRLREILLALGASAR